MAMGRMEGMRSMSFLYVMLDNGEGGTSYEVTGFSHWKIFVTTQAALRTSILAAMALQQFCVVLPDSVAASMMQYENTGPLSLTCLLLRSAKHGRGLAITLLAVVLLTSTTLTQFTSTILLSDVTPGLIPDAEQESLTPYDFTRNNSFQFAVTSTQYQGHDHDYGTEVPAVYPTFAEYSKLYDAVEGVHDTGTTIRAFIPVFPQARREVLKSYTGMATIIDTRVVCMRPMVDELNISMAQNHTFTSPFLTGRLGTNLTAARFFTDNVSHLPSI